MDYKYIELLIERYFQCQTNEQEEQILRHFFLQDEVPQNLAQYNPLFETLSQEQKVQLPDSFDTHMAAVIARQNEKAQGLRPIIGRINRALSPFYKAVASVALIITVGIASSRYWNAKDADPVEYNYSKYTDTYTDPQVASEQVSNAMLNLSDIFKGQLPADNDSTTVTQQKN